MKTMRNTLYALLGIGMLTACSSDDLPLTQSDEARIITFSASMEKVITRTTEGHRDWSKDTDPLSMNVFGWVGDDNILKGVRVDYNTAGVDVGKWTYAPEKYWADYIIDNKDYGFVACMPYNEGSEASYEGGKYTVSMPVSIPNGILTNTQELPMISHLNSNPAVGQVVEFDMDQTLVSFDIQFSMDERMAKLRFFDIKEVKIEGNMPVSGTVKCGFTKSDLGHIQDITSFAWSNVETGNIAPAYVGGEDHAPLKVDVYGEVYKMWDNSTFYAIPSPVPTDFEPTITVTYDVHIVYEGNDEITRKDVTSSIVFNKANFGYGSDSALKAGNRYPIKIRIMPKYLYVLADVDQTYGYLLIE